MNREIEIAPYAPLLIYKQGYTLEFVRSIIQERNLEGLRIFAHLKDDRLKDLDFLKEYTFLNRLDIASVDDYDFSFLLLLKGLKRLSINIEGKNRIDLSDQINLENLAIEWRNGKIFGLENCQNLTSLCLINFKEEDFIAIESIIKLKELNIKTASVRTCNGLENLTALENLSLGYCENLKSIHQINGKQNLKSLSIEACSKIEDYESLEDLPNLQNLELIDCKGIKSIGFISRFPSLKKLSLLGNTDILDGDMTPATKVEELFYKHRKHYNVKIENKKADALEKKNMEKLKESFKQQGW
jgi:Leucine-rich repeat (LRR) protein